MIGIDIEISAAAFKYNDPTYWAAYNTTCEVFGPVFMSTDAPFVFYCGSGDDQTNPIIEKYVTAFYTSGSMPSGVL